MSKFPTVGVIGAGYMARMMIAPAIALGINLKVFAHSSEDSAALNCDFVVGDYTDGQAVKRFAEQCDVITFEDESIPQSVIAELEKAGVVVRPRSEALIHSQNWATLGRIEQEKNGSTANVVAVMVARSPHGQYATWAATEMKKLEDRCIETITPAPHLSETQRATAQKVAIEVADHIGLVGVMAVEMFLIDGQLVVHDLALRPHDSALWTIDGSITSQFEQHLRAILDLPLGDTQMRAPYAVTGNVVGGIKADMYRPYLHLFARTPQLKVHQYRTEVKPGSKVGHITALGDNLDSLYAEVRHAVDYMTGTIDE